MCVHNGATHFGRQILVSMKTLSTFDTIFAVPRCMKQFTRFLTWPLCIGPASNKNWFHSYRNVIESVGQVGGSQFQAKAKKRMNNFFAHIEKFTHFMHCEKLKHIIITCDWNAMCTSNVEEGKVLDIGHAIAYALHFERKTIITNKKKMAWRNCLSRLLVLLLMMFLLHSWRITLLFIIIIEYSPIPRSMPMPHAMAATVTFNTHGHRPAEVPAYFEISAIRCKRFADCAHDLRIKAV